MAGRNQKSAADYFSHDADASSDEKIIYLESLFGNTGYAIYFKFLERMTRADGFKIEWNDIKKAIYASEFHISVTEIDRFISECCRKEIKAFVLEEYMLFSPGLIKRMSPLIDKREYNRLKYEEKKNKEIKSLTISEDTNPISVTEITQSKEKESKEKERKEKNIYTPSSEILEFSQNFIDFISKTKQNLAPKSENLLLESCKTVDKLIKLDGFDLEYIRLVLLWAVDDDFWSSNIFSLSGLRSKKKGDPRTKFQKIASSYDNNGKHKKINNRSANNLRACSDFVSED